MNISKIKIIKDGVETILNLEDKTIFRDFWDETSDFVISDENDNVIVQFQGGHLKTKNFDSSQVSHSTSVAETDNGDFTISDENGNCLVICKNGDIITKNFDSSQYEFATKFEGGGISSSDGIEYYEISSFKTTSRSAYFIDVKGSSKIKLYRPYYVFMYDSNHTYLIALKATSGEILPLKEGTKYVRLSISVPNIEEDSMVFYGATESPVDTKKVAQRVEQGEGTTSTNRSEKLVFKCNDQFFTTADLMLPPNYSIDGYKVPLILWDSGDGDYTSWYHEMGISYLNRINGLKFCRDMGFAVLSVFSWGNDNYEKYSNNNRASMPLPTHLLAQEAGVKYVCDRYNIDAENIFQLSKSGSGKLSMYYALHKPNFNLKEIYAMAPVFDDFVFLGAGSLGYRRAMYADMRFENVGNQLDYFINGTPTDKGGSEAGTSWRFGGNYKETDTNAIANIKEAQDFIVKNGNKFLCMGVSWENLIGQTFREKIVDTTKFSSIYWYNIIELTEEPSDWNANYNNYYILDDTIGIFLQLDRQSAPEFELGKYYKRQTFNPGDSTLEQRCFNRDNLNMIANGVPMTVIMAKNDEQTPYWNCLEVVKQIRNSGGPVNIITLSTGGHSAPDMGGSVGVNAVANVETLYGATYEIVSIGWFLAVTDIIRRYLKKESVGFPIISFSNNTISISSQTSGASIYYTTDGSEPTTNSTLYSEPIQVSQGDNYTLKAVAYKSGLWYSDTMSKEVLYSEE